MDFPRKDGSILRDHLEHVAKITGEIPVELLENDISPPPVGHYLWFCFWQVNKTKAPTEFLTFSELNSYMAVTKTELSPMDVDTLLQMDDMFVSQVREITK